jgi:hypothetical protein
MTRFACREVGWRRDAVVHHRRAQCQIVSAEVGETLRHAAGSFAELDVVESRDVRMHVDKIVQWLVPLHLENRVVRGERSGDVFLGQRQNRNVRKPLAKRVRRRAVDSDIEAMVDQIPDDHHRYQRVAYRVGRNKRHRPYWGTGNR